jgi:hypothetical protein
MKSDPLIWRTLSKPLPTKQGEARGYTRIAESSPKLMHIY